MNVRHEKIKDLFTEFFAVIENENHEGDEACMLCAEEVLSQKALKDFKKEELMIALSEMGQNYVALRNMKMDDQERTFFARSPKIVDLVESIDFHRNPTQTFEVLKEILLLTQRQIERLENIVDSG